MYFRLSVTQRNNFPGFFFLSRSCSVWQLSVSEVLNLIGYLIYSYLIGIYLISVMYVSYLHRDGPHKMTKVEHPEDIVSIFLQQPQQTGQAATS